MKPVCWAELGVQSFLWLQTCSSSPSAAIREPLWVLSDELIPSTAPGSGACINLNGDGREGKGNSLLRDKNCLDFGVIISDVLGYWNQRDFGDGVLRADRVWGDQRVPKGLCSDLGTGIQKCVCVCASAWVHLSVWTVTAH